MSLICFTNFNVAVQCARCSGSHPGTVMVLGRTKVPVEGSAARINHVFCSWVCEGETPCLT